MTEVRFNLDAIQPIGAAPAPRVTIELGPGTYRLAEPLHLPESVTIRGYREPVVRRAVRALVDRVLGVLR